MRHPATRHASQWANNTATATRCHPSTLSTTHIYDTTSPWAARLVGDQVMWLTHCGGHRNAVHYTVRHTATEVTHVVDVQ